MGRQSTPSSWVAFEANTAEQEVKYLPLLLFPGEMFQDPLSEYLHHLSFYGVIQEDPKYGQKVIVDVTS